ncbi:Vitamin B12 transporter BtuB [Stieleria maiorica]|uniref:Vitamin B12 transporter BtuB n=1 Tax=Stieleria maiorica TaxID=2795974 RepID=A0A5B9MH26_9BACT|nr:TonB-dependent receptor plug domain-containing protein [Stieleria maiorica]QEG00582.1 Vitamin B12 transporter BtuB [Stieleria maiorica]
MIRSTLFVLCCLAGGLPMRAGGEEPAPAVPTFGAFELQGASEPRGAAGLVPVTPEPLDGPDVGLEEPAENAAGVADEPTGTEEPLGSGLGFDLPSLEEFSEQPLLVPVEAPATLATLDTIDEVAPVAIEGGIPAISRITPAAVTRIAAPTIWSSGARNLDELFDILVPNYQHVHQVATGPKMGMRGIISDRDDKILLKVNGRIMNNRGESGAYHERDLPLMGDLYIADFLRGPGGATDGPGAIAGVINLQTHTGLTFQGFDATVRQGFMDEFTATEFRYGRKFNEDSGVFLYYGFATQDGADQSDAPLVFGRSFTARDNIPVTAGEPVTFDVQDDGRGYRSKPKHKLHAQLTEGNLNAWVRYTRGGQQIDPDRRDVALQPAGDALPGDSFDDLLTSQAGYQQLTFAGKYLLECTETFDVEWMASWDLFDFERFTPRDGIITNREDEFYTRLLARWTPNERHTLAFGTAFSYEWFGLNSPGFPGLPANVEGVPPSIEGPWETDTFSLMGEYVLRFNERWTAFAGLRSDKHSYSDWLLSPRTALVFAPNERDTYKSIWTVANRRATDGDLRRQFVETGTFSEAEENESVEFRYERQPCDHLFFAASGFYQYYTAIGFDPTPTVRRQTVLGKFKIAGLELESAYRTKHYQWSVSHAYTQLVDGFLPDITRNQGITAEPYGFGSDLVSWSPQQTKLYANRQWNSLWSTSGSLRAYWGFPGDEDLANYNASLADPNGFLPYIDPGYKKAFRGSYFLDFGIQRDLCCGQGRLRLDFYNVLGWIDKDLNKRNVLRRAYYRSEAAAIALTYQKKF